MGKCSFCGKDAGFLRGTHAECRAKHEVGLSTMADLALRGVIGSRGLDLVERKLKEVAASSHVGDHQLRAILVDGWEAAVDKLLEDGVLSEQEETALIAYRDHFGLKQGELDRRGAYTSVAKAGVLRDVLEGRLPKRVKLADDLPFVLQRQESLVWLFPNAAYLEQRVFRRFEGRSQGVSIRIARGVYYRVGAFKGHPVETSQLTPVDCGAVALTTKHVYFGGSVKNFRVPYSKIVGYKPYEDGVGIWRDASNAKEQVFVTGDGWFTYNLARNLAESEGLT